MLYFIRGEPSSIPKNNWKTRKQLFLPFTVIFCLLVDVFVSYVLYSILPTDGQVRVTHAGGHRPVHRGEEHGCIVARAVPERVVACAVAESCCLAASCALRV